MIRIGRLTSSDRMQISPYELALHVEETLPAD